MRTIKISADKWLKLSSTSEVMDFCGHWTKEEIKEARKGKMSEFDIDETRERLGLKRFKVFEPETNWNRIITARTAQKAIDKAWCQFWERLPFTHCGKQGLTAREI